VIVSSEDHTILFINASAATTFGYSSADLVGQSILRLLPDAPLGRHDGLGRERAGSASNQSAAGWIVAGVRQDGETVPVEVRLSEMTTGPTRFLLTSIVDITDRLNLEARLAAATDSHLSFQRFVADLSARLGGIEPHEVDDVLRVSFEQVALLLELDFVMLWRRGDGDVIATATHQWIHPACVVAADTLASISFVTDSLANPAVSHFATPDQLADPADRELLRRQGIRSMAMIPLTSPRGVEGTVARGLALGLTTRTQEWTPATVERMRLIAGALSQLFARTDSHLALQRALVEIRRLRDTLVTENVELRRQAKGLRTSYAIVQESAAIRQVLAQVEQVAPTPATVLLLGETGTGKEVMAQAIHDLSPRHQRPMIRVSCAAIPTALIESELFGREKGAYTGALSRQMGRFEAANQSTLFLDEIGDLPMEVQVKLLRVLQDRVIERLGSTQPVKVDVRIIAATNRNLEAAVRDRTFREDLFYRLNVFPIVVPPLRERIDDIPSLVWSFIDEFSRLFGKTIESISKESLQELQRYPWPGNVRELRNVIERAVIVATDRQLDVQPPRLGQRAVPHAAMTLTALEIEHIRAVLESTNWRVRGAGGAAERLGLKPTTLESRMARLGISRKKAS
jgi:PAS domain S-box-containing protein